MSLTENGISLFMWIGLQVDPSWLHEAFGVQTIGQVDIEMVRYQYQKMLLLLPITGFQRETLA